MGVHDDVKTNLGVQEKQGKLGWAITLTLSGGVLLICSFVAQFAFGPGDGTGEHANDYATILGMIAAILLGYNLVWQALKDLYSGHMHMNELVALAVLAAFAIAKYQEAASIAFFMIISILIETRTAMGAEASIESLVRITPTRAKKVVNAQELDADAKELVPGDIVRVRPGDNIPADGQVTRGSSTVNQANITGESIPAEKSEGDEVFGGTINLTGVMDIKVTKAGTDTTLGRVKDLILQAERTRIPIMRMIDRYAVWYTPTVLMIVGIVLFFTFKMGLSNPWERAISMLVIACPCALILATPTAMVASLSAAARLGVLVKSVTDLEAARNMTAIIFDKTGTLTTGQLQVSRLNPMPGIQGVDLLRAAACVEQNSKHPVARAVTDVARKAKVAMPEPTEFEEVSGRGVRGVVEGITILVGRGNWIIEHVAALPAESVEQIKAISSSPEAEGLSILFVVRQDILQGWIGLEDNTRPQAAKAMDDLRGLGLKRLVIVTGDRESVAKRVAAAMHVDYRAEVLPHQKLEMVDELKARGHRVAVIGDGVNDAPALAAGDISIAMGAAGSDVAINSASIALMNNNLNRIPFLITLSRATSAVIIQNMLIGAVFIVLFMVLSAMGYVTPILAAFLHVASGLVVIFNSARLVRQGEDIELSEAAAMNAVRPAAVRQGTQTITPQLAATPAR